MEGVTVTIAEESFSQDIVNDYLEGVSVTVTELNRIQDIVWQIL